MIKEIFIRPEAELDIDDAYQYYEECRAGLGSDFILCVDEALSKIARTPEQYPNVYKSSVRRLLIQRFPFGVFFLIEPTRIIILAVMHARRDPKKWQNRT